MLIGSELINYAEGDIVHADDGNGKIISITCLFISKENYTNLVNLKDV